MAKLLLIDDQVLFVESLRSVLQSRGNDFEVVAVAYDGPSGVRLATQLQPDLILMDVRMPELGGVAATRAIRAATPGAKIIMLTTFNDDQSLREAIEAGAIGYLLKDITPETLISALRAALEGVFLVTPSIVHHFADSVGDGQPQRDDARGTELPDWYYTLSRKERQMLRLVVEGYNNDEIAKEVNLATQTVRNYLSRIYEKLGVHGRTDSIKSSRAFLRYL